MAKPFDAAEIYDKALTIVNDALDGKMIEYDVKNAAFEVIKPIMQGIYFERSRGGFSDYLTGGKDDE